MSPATEAKIWEIKNELYHLSVRKERLVLDLKLLEGGVMTVGDEV